MSRIQNPQYEIFQQIRLPLIVLVTYAHSYGGVAEGYSVLGCGGDIYEILKIVVSQTLAKAAVPTFFVISGYLFFANVEEWEPIGVNENHAFSGYFYGNGYAINGFHVKSALNVLKNSKNIWEEIL